MSLRTPLILPPLLLLLTTLLAAPAAAQPLGEGEDGLPGVLRVGAIVDSPGWAGGGLSAGYEFTEGVLGQGEGHHRLTAHFQGGVMPLRWLGVGLSLRTRYDWTNGGMDDGDRAKVAEPRLAIRAGRVFGALGVGAQLGLWLPGSDAEAGVFDGLSLEGAGLFTLRSGPLLLTGRLGYRLDRSGASAPNADALSRSDRLALQVSDSDALLLGLGMSYGIDAVELLFEATWDHLLGAAAPPSSQGPIVLSAGFRWWATDGVQLRGFLFGSPSARPEVDRGRDLVVIEPRFGMQIGVLFRSPLEPAAAPEGEPEGAGVRHSPPPPLPDPEVVAGSGGGEEAIVEPPPTAPQTGTVRGIVRSPAGPVEGARVRARIGEETDASEPEETGTDEQGRFELAGLPAGPGILWVDSQGLRMNRQHIEITPGGTLEVRVELEPGLPIGEIRGIVRGADGSAVRATIRVQPRGRFRGGASIEFRNDPDGAFAVEVRPGIYRISVYAQGHAAQRRRVVVEEHGVTLVNVDLLRSRRH
ncbi:MAG: carboxypeptidase-like regulatory domain-containing protein [Myxococcales bacterium]|nr:carboxypeptidase-like regulatory domain-containing protein [Myxococcales bacterium]